MTEVVIVGAARTPQGKLLGALAPCSGTSLGSHAIEGALSSAGVAPDLVDAVVMGQVLQAGAGQGPARQAAIGAGISWRAHCTTVNKVCLSGLSAIIDAARIVRSGEAAVVVAGGMESMTNAPHLLPQSRRGQRYGHASLLDSTLLDGLTDAYEQEPMGTCTDRATLDRHPSTREEQDAIAVASHQRAAQAWADGLFADEIVPVSVGEHRVSVDEGVRRTASMESLAKLKPAFVAGGSITAGNASQLSDGAAAVVLTTREHAEAEGWSAMASLRSVGQVAGPDNALHAQPAAALRLALEREGWTVEDLDHIEINEAFAVVAAVSARELGISHESINPHGGGIALGHPIGASGARLVVHAAHELQRGVAKRAGVALCGGGGQGEALLLEA